MSKFLVTLLVALSFIAAALRVITSPLQGVHGMVLVLGLSVLIIVAFGLIILAAVDAWEARQTRLWSPSNRLSEAERADLHFYDRLNRARIHNCEYLKLKW